MLIPKHILQIAIGKEYLNRLPVEIIKNNLLDLNPSFEYTLLTDSTCEEFLNNNFKNASDFNWLRDCFIYFLSISSISLSSFVRNS